jgi:hypothetical protein
VEEPNGQVKMAGEVVAEKNQKEPPGAKKTEEESGSPAFSSSSLSLSVEPHQIHAIVSPDGSPTVSTAARGHGRPIPLCLHADPLLWYCPTMCNRGVALGRKRRQVWEAEDVGTEGLEGDRGGGGVP